MTETKSCFIKKFGTTEVEYTPKFSKIVEVEDAINIMIKLKKKKGDKVPKAADHLS